MQHCRSLNSGDDKNQFFFFLIRLQQRQQQPACLVNSQFHFSRCCRRRRSLNVDRHKKAKAKKASAQPPPPFNQCIWVSSQKLSACLSVSVPFYQLSGVRFIVSDDLTIRNDDCCTSDESDKTFHYIRASNLNWSNDGFSGSRIVKCLVRSGQIMHVQRGPSNIQIALKLHFI